MEARNYAPNATHNMMLPADAQIVSGVLGNAVYLPIGCGTLEMSGTLDALGVSLWRTWDGVTETDSVRGIFSFKNFASYFDNVSGKLCVTLPGGTVVQTDIDDDTELTHWVFNFIKNGTISIYKNAVKVCEAQSAEDAVDLTDGFTLGGGKTHATFDEVYVHTELLKDEEVNGLFYLIRNGMPQQQIQEIAQNGAAKYLGVTETVPDNRGVLIVKGEHLGTVYANTGDWVLMSKTVGGWKTGVCYRWSGVMWINLEPEYNYEAQYQACLSHIFEIPELTQNTGHYGALFAKLIAAQEAFIEKLITNEAFVNKLATNEAFIDRLITKRLLVDSDTADPNNFELAINESAGILAKKDGERVFEVSPGGNGFFSGSIEAGPLSLSLKSPGEHNFSFPNETRIYTICKDISTAIKGAGLFYCSGEYGKKELKAISIYHDHKISSFDRVGGKYFKGNYGIWQAIYQRMWRLDSTTEKGIIEFVFTDNTKEQLSEEKQTHNFTHIEDRLVRKSWDFKPGEENVVDPKNFSTGEIKTTKALNVSINADSYTLLWKNLPLGAAAGYVSGTVYRDNDGRLYVVP